MAANNVETAFRLPSVIEGSYRTPYQEFIMKCSTEENGFNQHQQQLLFTGVGKKKNQRTPSRACLPSSSPLQELKIVLMRSGFIELVR